ncbi:MAG: aspartate-semialdehyde dehydrogenase [Erysipelotrichaceae bacterium]|nr:aspartate-semialdehyde dehydrogenase [Erysipelotrichaceae bacterium]
MNIGIIGATGVVGRQMIDCLIEEKIKVDNLRLFASEKSAGQKIKFLNNEVEIETINENSFKGLDIVLGAASNNIAKEVAPLIKKTGAVFIDNSSYFRLFDDVPLIIPEINGEEAKKHNGIISNPNCSTIITLLACNAINKISPIKSLIVSTYQAVSGAGKEGMNELLSQINDSTFKPNVFPYEIAYNLIPSIGSPSDDDYTSEEMKLENEGRKIMNLPDLNVTCTCVRVPILRSHSISISLQCEKELNLDEVKESLRKQKGVIYYDDLVNKKYPMPILSSNQNNVYVGRLRKDKVLKGGVALFCSGDQIRKGAASNAVSIIKCL